MNADQEKSFKIRPGERPKVTPIAAAQLVLLGLAELWFPRYWFSSTSGSSRRVVIGTTVLVGVALAVVAFIAGKNSVAFGMLLGFGLLALFMAAMDRHAKSK